MARQTNCKASDDAWDVRGFRSVSLTEAYIYMRTATVRTVVNAEEEEIVISELFMGEMIDK